MWNYCTEKIIVLVGTTLSPSLKVRYRFFQWVIYGKTIFFKFPIYVCFTHNYVQLLFFKP